MPAERTDFQSVRAPQIVRKSRPDEFLDSTRSARGRSPGTRTSAVGRHHERMGKDVGRARIGPTDENWAGGVLPCDVVPVVREHANRHEGSEFASPKLAAVGTG